MADTDQVAGSAAAANSVTLVDAQAEKAKQEERWRTDLTRLEYEIDTLRTVLGVKHEQAAELKRKLGITPIVEIRQDLQQGLETIRNSDVYQKTGTAFKNFGDYASQKLTDMRNSTAFKSFEDKLGETYQNVKKRSSTQPDSGNEDALLPSRSENSTNGTPSSPIVTTPPAASKPPASALEGKTPEQGVNKGDQQ